MTPATQARICRAILLIEDHIRVLSGQGVPLPIVGLEVATRELRQIGGVA
ncbi:hypothetical protein [Paracoccus yeei]|nr:hypothetical protein [Paracoccus yeei]